MSEVCGSAVRLSEMSFTGHCVHPGRSGPVPQYPPHLSSVNGDGLGLTLTALKQEYTSRSAIEFDQAKLPRFHLRVSF